ncbi:hypothetical protein D1872_305760 [compost metagenome]
MIQATDISVHIHAAALKADRYNIVVVRAEAAIIVHGISSRSRNSHSSLEIPQTVCIRRCRHYSIIDSYSHLHRNLGVGYWITTSIKGFSCKGSVAFNTVHIA